MGYSTSAVSKGLQAECLAKFLFLRRGYVILNPEGHETHFDFVAYDTKRNKAIRVQVKSDRGNEELVRFSNKRGCKNTRYQASDYDILVGVWVEKLRLYIFNSNEINSLDTGSELTVARKDGKPLLNRKRISPNEVVDLTETH